MSAESRSLVHDAPLHVRLDESGAVRLFLPDGRSLALSEEAARVSLRSLSRAVARRTARSCTRPAGQSNVIAVNFRPV